MTAITKLTFASALVIASASCKHRQSAAATNGSGSAMPTEAVVDPTTASPAATNIAPNQVVDAASDALPGSGAAPVAIAPTMPPVDAASDGGSASGAVSGTTNGTPTPDAF